MIIAGFEFKQQLRPTLLSVPGTYLYIHQTSGKCFVSSVRKASKQRSAKNYPTQLKDLLKVEDSQVIIYLAELPNDYRETLYSATMQVSKVLAERGSLFKDKEATSNSIYGKQNNVVDIFAVWIMTHKETGAVYYFADKEGVDVMNKISQRMLTYNNHVIKKISHVNRTMMAFVKNHFPVDVTHWVVRDTTARFTSEIEAQRFIVKQSKNSLDEKIVVLNRINSMDITHYCNHFLKLPTVSIEQYLKTA